MEIKASGMEFLERKRSKYLGEISIEVCNNVLAEII